MMGSIQVVDMFCGAGGTSSGLYEAADDLGIGVDLLAINHWKIAIATHSANHTHARHMCETLDSVDPRKAVPSGRLHLMVASPECTHHSNARGGKPMNDQSRASAWHVLRWAEALRVDNIIVENVREFQSWGPLGVNGRPVKSRRGETFQAFLQALRSLGYTVDYRILNAADYGDPTTRERLFVMARKGRQDITWPEPTHAKDPGGKRKPWRAAKEIIDWTIQGESIFRRRRPLSPNTMRRIEAGLRKFGGPDMEPFLVVLRGRNKGRSMNLPAPALTAGGQHVGLCEPFIIPFFGENAKQKPRVHDIKAPLPTVTGHGAGALVEPFLVKYYGTARAYSVKEPLDTVTAKDRFALCEPFMLGQQSGARPRSVKQPVPTIAGAGAVSLIQPFIVGFTHTGAKSNRVHSVEKPVPTLVTKAEFALVEPKVEDMRLDIRFRMLQPHELARAQSFRDDYKFTGSRAEQVKQIGNAVPTQLARALCRAALGKYGKNV